MMRWTCLLLLLACTGAAEETHRGIVRRPLNVTCFGGCGDLYLEPDSGDQRLYIANSAQYQYLWGGLVGMHVELTGYLADCDGCRPLIVTRLPLPLSPADAADPPLPFRFGLHPNYPNPFNPSTQIEYELPAAGRVELTVYDLLGRPVAALVSGAQPAGTHRTEWNAQGFPGGVYIARISYTGSGGSRRVDSLPLMLLR
jgi:hypothetical protein